MTDPNDMPPVGATVEASDKYHVAHYTGTGEVTPPTPHWWSAGRPVVSGDHIRREAMP